MVNNSIKTGQLGINSSIDQKVLLKNPSYKPKYNPYKTMNSQVSDIQKINKMDVPSMKGMTANMTRSKNKISSLSEDALRVASTVLETQKNSRADTWERNLTSMSGQKRKFADDAYPDKSKPYRKTYTDTTTDLGKKRKEW